MAAGATARISYAQLFLALTATFTVATGYGVILPAMPYFLEHLAVHGERFSVSWHTGMLTGVYMFALFVFAPLWGRVSDRFGRWRVMLLGLAGFSVTMVLFALAWNLAVAYLARVLGGLFSAAVLPVSLAVVGDTQAPERRARGFAWISAANALGFLVGPALGGWLTALRLPDVLAAWLRTDFNVLPFLAAAAMGALAGAGIYGRFSEPSSVVPIKDAGDGEPPNGRPLTLLLALTEVVMFGLGSVEVGITLLGQQRLSLTPADVGLMFVECSLIMIIAQALIFSPLVKRLGRIRLLVPAFLSMAAGVALLPATASYPLLIALVGLIAAGSGLLIPALTYSLSLAAGAKQGAVLGKQTAVTSLGQALGSVAAGWLFATQPSMPFWLTAGLLAAAALFGLRAGIDHR